MRYHDLVLRLGRRSGAISSIRAQCGSTHGARADDAWHFDGDRARKSITAHEGVQFGDAFPHEVHLQFERCLGATLDHDRAGVRLRLVIDDPGLVTFPWEYLREDSAWLAASVRTPVVRWLDLPEPVRPLTVTLPLRMLVVIPDHPDLDTAAERRILEDALADVRGDVDAQFLEGRVTRETLTRAVEDGEWHVLHYIGHGDFAEDRAVLLLNDEDDGIDAVGGEWVVALLHNQERLRLVVLNSCRGATTSAARPLAGMAPLLVQAGVPAVVAMQDAILDEHALAFARTFYHHLLRGPDRGRVDIAISHARNELLKKSLDDRRDRDLLPGEGPGTAHAVGIPVLYLRSGDGVLFNVVPRSGREVPWSAAARDTALVVRDALGRVAENARSAGRTGLAEQETRERRRLLRRVRLRDAAIASAFAVACVAFFALWIGLFDWLPKQFKPEHYTVWLGDLLRDRPLDDAVRLVTIDRATLDAVDLGFGEPNTFDPAWRAAHADVVERLAGAGAAVVAFDMTFPVPVARYDSGFARAIASATERGTRVVVAVGTAGPDGAPAVSPVLLDAGAGWGSACLALPREAPNVVPLLARAGSPDRLVPALSLAAVAAFDDARTFALDSTLGTVALLTASGIARQHRIARLDVAVQSACSIIPRGARVADMILPYSPLAGLRARRVAWEDVRRGEAAALAEMRGRIVFVGAEVEPEAFTVWHGLDAQTRYGVQLHADAAGALLSGRSDRFLGATSQFALILVMALGGAAVAVRPPRRLPRRATLAALAVAYMMLALVLYLSAGLLANALYHLLALLVGYRAVRGVKQRFFA